MFSAQPLDLQWLGIVFVVSLYSLLAAHFARLLFDLAAADVDVKVGPRCGSLFGLSGQLVFGPPLSHGLGMAIVTEPLPRSTNWLWAVAAIWNS
jgi:hypothetical protein